MTSANGQIGLSNPLSITVSNNIPVGWPSILDPSIHFNCPYACIHQLIIEDFVSFNSKRALHSTPC